MWDQILNYIQNNLNIMDLLVYFKENPLIVVLAIIGWLLTNKNKQISISTQIEPFNNIIDKLAEFKLNLLNVGDAAKVEELKEKISILEKDIYKLKLIGSSRLRNWLNDRLSHGGINNVLTDVNIDDLIYIVRLELGAVSLFERVKTAISKFIKGIKS